MGKFIGQMCIYCIDIISLPVIFDLAVVEQTYEKKIWLQTNCDNLYIYTHHFRA